MSRFLISDYPNRTLCAVLEEMRTAYKTRNFSYLLSLIEEAQTMGNRMEAALEDGRDIRSARETIKEAKEELQAINREIKAKEELKKLIK